MRLQSYQEAAEWPSEQWHVEISATCASSAKGEKGERTRVSGGYASEQ
jgi:hypothetical protein